MKVIHFSTTDYGGAFKAAYRISKSMQSVGIDSKVFVRSNKLGTNGVEEVINSPVKMLISRSKNFINLCLSRGEIISDYFGTDISKLKVVREADVIFLHWVNSFVSYRCVEKLLNMNKKVIWVMHDMWLFTGGCHCDYYCGRYKTQCGKCPLLHSNRVSDKSKKNFVRKMKMLAGKDILLVGPSKWIADCAEKSLITHHKRIEVIPNPIDYQVFHPLNDIKTLRNSFQLDRTKKVILFGAVNSTEDKNKGIESILQLFSLLNSEEYIMIVFGNRLDSPMKHEKFKIINVGYISSEKEMSELYNRADVFLAPSTQESYGYTVAEAIACGTPVVAYNIGGIRDQIIHRKNGYLAKLHDIDDLKQGIEFCTTQLSKVDSFLKNDYQTVGNAYMQLCRGTT